MIARIFTQIHNHAVEKHLLSAHLFCAEWKNCIFCISVLGRFWLNIFTTLPVSLLSKNMSATLTIVKYSIYFWCLENFALLFSPFVIVIFMVVIVWLVSLFSSFFLNWEWDCRFILLYCFHLSVYIPFTTLF